MNKTQQYHQVDAETSPDRPRKRQKTCANNLNNGVHESPNGVPTSHNQYTVAWICALHIEMAAACAMLDVVHEDPRLQGPANDNNAYEFGSIARHNVVIACLPTGQYGTNNAANVLTNLVRSFPSISMALMVGIGGGAPSKADIRLGDVVVGTRVMQYDLGKILNDGQLHSTASPRPLDQSLGKVVSILRAKHELRPSPVLSILEEKLGQNPRYGRPTSPDRLFLANYPHPSSIASCDGCDRSELVSRSTRSNDLEIRYGGIASGNQVMKSGTTRDKVAEQLDIICFEMEAAGLMDILPCLPIRGICDYSDSHKSKEWQRYAAATAAAYAREFLEVLHVAEVRARDALVPDNCPLHDRRQHLLDSLGFEQIDSRKTTIDKAHAQTCKWFLKHLGYKAWLDPKRLTEHHGFLWIRGKPGAGKSTMMKFAYLNAKRRARGGRPLVASFFFNARGEYLERSISGMYRSLLLQLLEGFVDLQVVLEDPEVVPKSQNDCPHLNDLKDLFCNAVFALGQRPFTCFIDALDECDEQQVMDMVQFFEELAESSTKQGIPFRICFSSRHYPYIDIRQGIRLTLEDQPEHAEDLASYVKGRLRIGDPTLVAELSSQILEKAAGVFLWVVLVVEILNKEHRQGRPALRKRLAEIPSGLSNLFKNILRRDKVNMEDLRLCILWILFAKRPLRPTELYHALWWGLSLKGLVDSEVPDVASQDGDASVDKFVISSSKGLAEITKSKQPTAQFIHESVRDFLIKDKGLHELWPDVGFDSEIVGTGHERLKQYCESYINHALKDAFVCQLLLVPEPRASLEISKKYPFLEYASQYVLDHANTAADVVPQDDFLSRLPLPDWIRIMNLFERYKVREYSQDATLFYILADRGFSSLIRTRLKENPNAHVFGERFMYPLFAAVANGNKDAVAALLGLPSRIYNGVDITDGLMCKKDETPFKKRTLLSWAAANNRIGIVELLLQQGFSINQVDGDWRTPLSRAIISGHMAIAVLLIKEGADIEAQDGGSTPLLWASQGGHTALAELLIKEGADIEAQDSGLTPLSWASRGGHTALAELLIKKGANADIR